MCRNDIAGFLFISKYRVKEIRSNIEKLLEA